MPVCYISAERVDVTALGANPTNTGGFEMPMVELTTTKGALDDAAKQRLAGELSTIALELEAAPFADFGDAPHMQALSWCFVNEQEVFVGGEPHPRPIYRVTVTIPEGAPGVFGPLAERGREKLVERVTAAVLAAEGSEYDMVEAHRVWVHLRQITNGHWGGFGEVFTLPDAQAYGLKTDEPGSKIDRMRQAAMQSVGAVTAG
jgi:phenylpyruvate tautomerase PptA (4-oxalocrotonate tautomerase family)